MSKLRCRLLDWESGKPQPNVTVTLLIKSNGSDTVHVPLSSLCSDQTGYLAFDLQPLGLDQLHEARFYLSAPEVGLRDYDLLGSLRASPTAAEPRSEQPEDVAGDGTVGVSMGTSLRSPVFVVYVNAAKDSEAGHSCGPRLLPSIQSPDAYDYEVSPYSFVAPRSVTLGDDCCSTTVPSTLPLQQYKFYNVVVHRETATDREDLPEEPQDDERDGRLTRPVPGVVTVSGDLAASSGDITFGEVQEYVQDWHSLGHCLGELQYSLPLAPGESTQLAVLDWSRSDAGSRVDDLRASEFLDHDLRRDRAIDETVEAALREEQGGNSHMGGTSGTASGSQYVTWTGNHAFGGGISYSYGKRNLDGDDKQDLHDRVRQASASVRSAKSTVVVQGAQAERSSVQTRRVANHNHCHALTVQYYEVLRQYRVVTRFTGQRPVVLLPFALITFSWQMALRFRTVLTRALLDPTLEVGFDALLRLHQVPAVYDSPLPLLPAPGPPVEPPMLEQSVKVTGTDEGGVRSTIILRDKDKVTMSASGLLALTQDSTGHGYNGVGPEGDLNIAPSGGAHPFVAPGLPAYGLIYKIGVVDGWHEVQVGPSGTGVSTITATRAGELIFSINDQRGLFADNTRPNLDHWTVNVSYPSREVIPTPTDPTKAVAMLPRYVKVDDLLSEAKLLAHLSNNSGHYNTAVWMLMDAVERRLYMEQALRLRRNLLDGIDDRPLAVSGSLVAFAFRGVLATPPDPDGAVTTPDLSNIVTLPTRGLFAEAEMGHCNSCEKRDATRMWNWDEMSAETPPDITGLSPGPRGTAPSLTAAALPGAVVQITQPQNAPDPNGLGDAIRALQTPNIFRDMAGLAEVSHLLGQLVASAGDANSRQLAAQAKDKVDAVAASSGGVADAPSGVSAADSADRMSLLPEIKSFAKDLGLTNEEYKEFALNTAYGTRPTGQGKAKPSKNGSTLSLFVEGRVSRDGKITQEPLSGLLSLYLSRSMANAQDVPMDVLIDLTQGVGGTKITVVRDEPYMLRPVIRISADAIANRLDEALAAIRFEIPGLELGALKSMVRSKYSSSHSTVATGSTHTFPLGESVATFELLANVETVENAATEVVLDAKVGVTGNTGAQASFDSSKLGEFATAITDKLLDAESRAVGGLISGVLNTVTVKAQLGNVNTASGGITVGSKLIFKPQVLRSISLEPK